MNFFLLIAFTLAGCIPLSSINNPPEGSRSVGVYSSWYKKLFELVNSSCYPRVVPVWGKIEKNVFLAAVKSVDKKLGTVVGNRPTYERALSAALGVRIF